MSVLNDVWGSIHDAGSPVLGYDTYAQQEANQRAERAEKLGKKERAELGERNRALRDDINGYDDPAITSTENWAGYSHADIYRHNQSINEGKADETARAWQKLGKALRERGPDFDSKLKSIIGNGWEGEAADKAATVGEPVRKWLEGSGGAFEMTGNRLEQAASGAGQAKQMVPEPEEHSWGRSAVAAIPLGPSGAGADAVAQMRERREAENQAREAMDRVYSRTLTHVDAGIPRFQKPDGSPADPPPVTPQDPTDWGGGGGGSGGGPGSGGGSGGSGGGSGGSGGGSDSGGGSGPDDGDSTPPIPSPGPTPAPPAPPGPTTPDGPAQSDPSWRTPSPEMPSGPGGPNDPGGSGRQSPGGGGFVGAPGGMAGGAGAGGDRTVGAGGRSGAGATGGARGGGMAGAAAPAGARGGAGRGGMVGGMGGQRGQGAEDEEHEHPSWLEELDDVWFNDMPRTAPPVLGE